MVYELETLIVSGISGIAAFTIAVFAIIQAYSTKKQTNLMKKEIESRLRPWLSPIDIVPILVSFQDGMVISFDDANEQMNTKQNKSKPLSQIYEFKIKNFGAIPAQSQVKIIHKKSKIEQKDLEKQSKIFKPIIMPGETKSYSVKFDYDYLKDGGIFYAGVLLEYPIDENQISKIGKIWKIGYESIAFDSEEIDDPDLPTKK